MKKKILINILFIISIIPMFFNWFGTIDGNQITKGTEILFNPITIMGILVYMFCIWYLKPNKTINVLSIISLSSIIVVEMVTFINWLSKIASGQLNNQVAYIGFFIGGIFSISMLVIHIKLSFKKIK